MQNEKVILAAEADPADAEHLRDCLSRLRYQVYLANSAAETLELMRRNIFTNAIVGVELKIGAEPVLAVLSHLPATERLIATGRGDDSEAERLSRLAGAHLYLPRPVNIDRLAKALGCDLAGTYIPTTTKTKRRQRA